MLHYYMQLLVFISLDYDYMYDLYVYITYICMLRKVIRLCNWYDLSIRQVALEARKSLKIAKASIWQSKFPVLCHAWNQKMLLVKQRECWQFLTGEALPQFRIWSSRASKARVVPSWTQHMMFDLNCFATLQPHFLFMLLHRKAKLWDVHIKWELVAARKQDTNVWRGHYSRSKLQIIFASFWQQTLYVSTRVAILCHSGL